MNATQIKNRSSRIVISANIFLLCVPLIISFLLIEAFFRQNNIKYIDLYYVLKDKFRTNSEIQWYYDDIHLYKPGYALIGEYLANEIPQIFPHVFAPSGFRAGE